MRFEFTGRSKGEYNSCFGHKNAKSVFDIIQDVYEHNTELKFNDGQLAKPAISKG
jgi:hypothetical protein